MSNSPVIVWFRQDLRLSDHRALTASAESGRPVVPLYILDDEPPGPFQPGGASRWWLHGSLTSLAARLEHLGSRLVLRRGRAIDVLRDIVRETGAGTIAFSRAYEPYNIAAEADLHRLALDAGFDLRRYAGALLHEPEAIRTKTNQPFKVFTPFLKACLDAPAPAPELPPPRRLAAPGTWPRSDDIRDWELLPTRPDWAGGLRETWTPGEAGARARLSAFVGSAMADYQQGRDRPDRSFTSMLSPHLHFGEISPRQCWHAAHLAGETGKARAGAASFVREIGWREFSTHLLFHYPNIVHEPFRPEFARFPWRQGAEASRDLAAWKRGSTGFPIVDAGMRQLWTTGWMHNRVRMIVASLLTKHLRIDWRDGAAWFWDTLVDADLANNSASWQWVAGSGADAAPYFRVFNPMLQGAKFDPEGNYVRRFVPELARLPAEHIHAPWLAPAQVLADAGVVLGRTYPLPIVDHAEGRKAALAAYEAVKTA